MAGHVTIPGFAGRVTMDDVDLDFNEARVAFKSGKLGAEWSISFPKPTVVSGSSLFSIGVRFAGVFRWLIEDSKCELYSGEDSLTLSVTQISSQSLSLSDNQDILNNYAIPKTYCFINQEWLSQVSQGSAYIDGHTGIVMRAFMNTAAKTYFGLAGVNIPATRFFDPRLPGENHSVYPDGTYDFKCFYARSHHDIARKLCSMIGINIQVNTPDVELIDTCTFQSGAKWFDVIKANFMMWSPNIDVMIDQNGTPTVMIEDVFTQNSITTIPYQALSVGNKAIKSISRQLSRPNDDRLVDHVVIVGRKSQNTVIHYEDTPDYEPVEIPAVELEPTRTITSTFPQAKVTKYKQLGEYTGSFGSGDQEWTVNPIQMIIKQLGYYEYKRGNQFKRIPVRETVSSYDNEKLVSQVVTSHAYSPDMQKVVKTQEKYYFFTNMPGSAQKQMEMLRVKTTLQNYVIKPLNLTMTAEIIEDKIVYNQSVVNQDGTPTQVNSDPKALYEVLRTNPNYVDPKPGTSQVVDQMTTYYRYTHIDRCSDNVLIKTEVSNNTLSQNLPQVNSQILDNPYKDTPSSTSKEMVFRREYKDPGSTENGFYINGRGPFYHPAKTIQHEDITDDRTANALAQRVWIRKNMALSPTLWDITLNIKIPVFLDFAATMVTLPDLVRKIDGANITLSGGSYIQKSVSYSIKQQGNKTDFDEQLILGSQL